MKTIMYCCVVGLLGCAGCNAPPDYSYVVSLDPRFSADWQIAAWNAMDSWQTTLDGHLGITFNYTGCLHQDHEICVYPSTKAAILAAGGSEGEIGFCRHVWYTDSSEVYIPYDGIEHDSAELRQNVLAHEFGHSMAIDFHIEPGNLMCYSDTCSNLVPTCSDASAWWAQRISLPWGWQGNKTCPPTNFTISGK